MRKQSSKRTVAVHALAALVLVQGLSGLVGGAALVLDPTGALLNIPREWIAGSIFGDYLIPGIILASLLGALPVAVAAGLWAGRRRAWFGALAVAVGLIVWIWVELLTIGYHRDPPLQLLYGSAGVLMLMLALLPSVRDHYMPAQGVPEDRPPTGM